MSATETATAADATFSLPSATSSSDLRDWAHGFAENVIRPAGVGVGRA